MSRIAQRGELVVNAKYDTEGRMADIDHRSMSASLNSARESLYDSVPYNSDHTLMLGEVAVARVNKHPGGYLEQPKVRTVLNGMVLNKKCKDKPLAVKKKMFRESIRLVGVCSKTVKYDSARPDIDPSDKPVIIVGGQLSTVNTGQKHIEVGNAVRAVLPSPTTVNQYQDGVNVFSPNRAVMAFEPLVLHHTFKKVYDDHENNGVRAAIHKIMSDMHENEKEKTALIAGFEESLKNAEVAARMDRMLHAARAATMAQMQRFVGVSTTSANVGERMQLAVHPITNLVSRAR